MSAAGGEQRVAELRQVARQLQRDLAGADEPRARLAAARLALHPAFAAGAIADLMQRRLQVSRAQILDVLAWENGCVTWAELLVAHLPVLARVTMYTPRMSLSLNQWFVAYDEAHVALRHGGGYLLPYRNQFVVVASAAVAELGLDPRDPDWQRIGFDWVRPRDAEAHLRLAEARFAAMLARGEELQ